MFELKKSIFVFPPFFQRVFLGGWQVTRCEWPKRKTRARRRRCHLKLFPLNLNFKLTRPVKPRRELLIQFRHCRLRLPRAGHASQRRAALYE